MEVPDIRFKVCPGLLSDTLGPNRYSQEITLQIMLSGAVLTLQDTVTDFRQTSHPPR